MRANETNPPCPGGKIGIIDRNEIAIYGCDLRRIFLGFHQAVWRFRITWLNFARREHAIAMFALANAGFGGFSDFIIENPFMNSARRAVFFEISDMIQDDCFSAIQFDS